MQEFVLWTEAVRMAGSINRDFAAPAALVTASVLSEWQSRQSLLESPARAAHCPRRQNAVMTRSRFALKATLKYQTRRSTQLYIRWRVIAIFCGGKTVMEAVPRDREPNPRVIKS
jgi:hypothetical protein